MQVQRLAVFGSSHVRNLSEYCLLHGPVFRVRFFYKPGMKARLIPKDEWKTASVASFPPALHFGWERYSFRKKYPSSASCTDVSHA